MSYIPTTSISSTVIPSIPILSFFTGAGFLDLGFKQVGFQPIWSNEANPFFVRGFEYAMSQLFKTADSIKITNTTSIADITSDQIRYEAFGAQSPPDIFGIIGGPPCPDFSIGGKNRGHEGDNGKLSLVYIQQILALQPTFFVFENVPGLISTKKHRVFFERLKSLLSPKYTLSMRVLNALEFGVAQDRPRVFLIGILHEWMNAHVDQHSSISQDDWFPWPTDPRYNDAKNRFLWPTTSPFGSEPDQPIGIPSELMVNHWIGDTNSLTQLPNGGETFTPHSDKFMRIAEGDVWSRSFRRLHRWRYSPTVAYGNNEVHLHPIYPRRLTVREALRLQSIPDTYVLPSNIALTHKFKMISNGVPLILAQKVAEACWKLLTGQTDKVNQKNYA
ncbi:DNA cytosine methyltransferase [Herpetosiphon giganteus]|uniref:DNA cytosine methyltransferase n=1 Tax=Herpetosiphon giganteus TaxID=2029754 RepID=UPI0019560427|nr:DNA cytosine methyltransferase [Herpetosiphon giganteus]MBM7841620.1 DNA (cytosine-5)-methyltransferase 1 [Herpetosiphon giganteus]